MQMPVNPQITILVAMSFAALFGLLLLRAGFRGRRIHDRPLCRKCDYELTGRAPDSVRCPECGGDIGSAAGVRIGMVERRKGILLAGVFILIWAGVWSTWVARKINWIKVKPVWLLTMEAKRTGPFQYNSAIQELQSRITAGGLSSEQVSSLVDTALGFQANRTVIFDREWARLIDAASFNRSVSDNQWRRYVTQALDDVLRLEVLQPIRFGDTITAVVGWKPGEPRCGGMSSIRLLIEGEPQLTIGNRVVELVTADSLNSTGGLLGTIQCGNAPHYPLFSFRMRPKSTEVEPGRWQVKYRVRLRAYDQHAGPDYIDKSILIDKFVELQDWIDVLPNSNQPSSRPITKL